MEVLHPEKNYIDDIYTLPHLESISSELDIQFESVPLQSSISLQHENKNVSKPPDLDELNPDEISENVELKVGKFYFNSSTMSATNQERLKFHDEYFTRDVLLQTVIPINNQTFGVSQRIIEWTVMNYAATTNLRLQDKDVFEDYTLAMNTWKKEGFDIFRRHNHVYFDIVIDDDNNAEPEIKKEYTTVGQLNFLHWANELGVLQFCKENKAIITADYRSKTKQLEQLQKEMLAKYQAENAENLSNINLEEMKRKIRKEFRNSYKRRKSAPAKISTSPLKKKKKTSPKPKKTKLSRTKPARTQPVKTRQRKEKDTGSKHDENLPELEQSQAQEETQNQDQKLNEIETNTPNKDLEQKQEEEKKLTRLKRRYRRKIQRLVKEESSNLSTSTDDIKVDSATEEIPIVKKKRGRKRKERPQPDNNNSVDNNNLTIQKFIKQRKKRQRKNTSSQSAPACQIRRTTTFLNIFG